MLVHDENSDIIFITESRTAEHIGEAEITGCNILDLVQSKPGELVEVVEITEPLDTSDHNVAKFKIPVAVPIDEDNCKTEYYDCRQANIKNMRKYLNQTKWEDILKTVRKCGKDLD